MYKTKNNKEVEEEQGKKKELKGRNVDNLCWGSVYYDLLVERKAKRNVKKETETERKRDRVSQGILQK